MADQQAKSGQKRGRSPSYPAIGLEEALRLARVLYDRENRSAVPLEAVIADWGLKPTSGRGWVVLAALLKFGLLQDQGKGQARKAKLTDLALSIILDEREDGSQRQQLIRTAALKPTIHYDLWKKYGPTLPSDATLRFYLEKERGFNPAAVPDLIRQFRQTVTFANVTEADKLTDDGGDSDEAETSVNPPPPAPAILGAMRESRTMISSSEVLQFPIPLPDTDELAGLQVPKRMSQVAWDQMMAIIKAYKPSIVKDSPPAGGDKEPEPKV